MCFSIKCSFVSKISLIMYITKGVTLGWEGRRYGGNFHPATYFCYLRILFFWLLSRTGVNTKVAVLVGGKGCMDIKEWLKTNLPPLSNFTK